MLKIANWNSNTENITPYVGEGILKIIWDLNNEKIFFLFLLKLVLVYSAKNLCVYLNMSSTAVKYKSCGKLV